MKFLSLTLIIFLYLTGWTQNNLENLLNLSKYKSPTYIKLTYISDDSRNITIPFDNKIVVIKSQDFDPSIIWVENNNKKILIKKQLLSHRIQQFYIEEIVATDLNNDEKLDLIITSVPPGPSGIVAELQQLTIILSKKNSFNIFEFSSFLLGKELILDYNNDNKFEFGCLHLLDDQDENCMFYTFNIFKIENDSLVNITKSIQKIPVFIKRFIFENKFKIIPIDSIPSIYRKNIIFQKPWDMRD